MIDTLSGFVEGQSSKTPKYVRFAKDIRLKVMMDKTMPDQIFRPLLIAEYVEVEALTLSPGSMFEVSFGVNYFSDYSKFMAKTLVTFWIILCVALLVVAMRMYAYTKRNPSKYGIKAWPLKFVEYFSDYVSEFMFWLIYLVCAIIFISFKIQVQSTMLLPEEGQASQAVQGPFYGLFFTTVVLKTIAISMKIYNQSKMDIFLIDHEQPNRITRSVVGWRHYFVANEFAELQGEERYISPEVTLIWFVFLWIGLGWQHVVKAEPDLSVVPDDKMLTNILLELFFAGILFFVIGAVQLILHRINSATSEDGSAVTGFVDLCTLANVSLLMFDEEAHGYYLHAQAPWRASDIPLVELSRAL
jgi:meckelin